MFLTRLCLTIVVFGRLSLFYFEFDMFLLFCFVCFRHSFCTRPKRKAIQNIVIRLLGCFFFVARVRERENEK